MYGQQHACTCTPTASRLLTARSPAGCTPDGESAEPAQGDVRLVPLQGTGATSVCDAVHAGAIEIFNDGVWGRICQIAAEDSAYTLIPQACPSHTRRICNAFFVCMCTMRGVWVPLPRVPAVFHIHAGFSMHLQMHGHIGEDLLSFEQAAVYVC